VQVSSKVSYSVLVYLERKGVHLEPFLENLDTPLEFYKDPSTWISVTKMEEFLQALMSFLQQKDPSQYIREIGQKNHELRAWGVLDSVLKMVESPKDIFFQPERFLSYFLTPHPELVIEKQDDNHIVVRMQKEPTAQLVHSYLVGAVEGLPAYTGRPPARIETLNGTSFQLTWFDNQQSLFDEQESKRRQLHPQIVNSVLESIKEQNKTLDSNQTGHGVQNQVTSEAFERMVSLEVEKRMEGWLTRLDSFDQTIFKIKNDFYKMYDYFTRAQQIITLVTPSARKASVREAMRRVDWDYVQKEFPRLVEGACDSILSIKHDLQSKPEKKVAPEETTLKQPTDLNQLIDTVVESLAFGDRSLKVDRQWLLDKDVHVDGTQITQVLESILKSSVSQIDRQGEIRLITRPKGSKVQIEISDTGAGFSAPDLEKIFDDQGGDNLSQSKKIIQDHHGEISVSSREGVGSTYLIELPIS